MFQKLLKSYPVPKYYIDETQLTFTCTDGGSKGIEYLKVICDPNTEFLNVIPSRYLKDFYLSVMRIDADIPAHTDSGIKTVINFYLKTDNCITQFFNIKSDSPHKWQVANQTDGYIYDEADLIRCGCFIANPMDIWVLDVSQPHSVTAIKEIKERLAVNLSTNLPYADVCKMLHETGNL